MRNIDGISKAEQVARWSMEIQGPVTAEMIKEHFGWDLVDAKRRMQDVIHSARYVWSKEYQMIQKGPRMYRILLLTVTEIKPDPKAAIPVIAVSRDNKGKVISIRRFRSAYVTVEEGFEHSSVIEAAQGKRRDHMHGGFAWRFACDLRHEIATLEHAQKYKFLSGSFKGLNLKGLQLAHEIKEK